MSILGNRVVRLEDPRFLVGQGRYVENLELEGALWVTFVRSPLAHARVNAIDASEAEALPNVQVFTGADVDAHPFGPPPHWHITGGMERPLVARDVVRFAGDIVAVVVSEDRASGLDAAELVMVDYDPLPAVLSAEEALKDEVLLFPEIGSNVANRGGSPEHDDGLFDGCDIVVSDVLVSQRLAAAPLEPRSAAAVVGDDGRLTLWATSQTPHMGKMVVAGLLGLDPAQVRVVSPDVGGGFGAKMVEPEGVLVAWLARKLGQPVRWTETRTENMLGLPQGRGQRLSFTLGGTREGRLLAYRFEVLGDAGAYPALGAFLPNLTALDVERCVRDPEDRDEHRVGRDQHDADDLAPGRRPTGGGAGDRAGDRPLRGRGRARSGRGAPRRTSSRRTPSRTRRRPARRTTRATTRARSTCCSARPATRSSASEQRRRRADGSVVELGIGLGAYVEISNPVGEEEFGEVEITEDGGAILRTGSHSHGQGHETTFAMIAAERLGLPVERVIVHRGDTDDVPKGTGTFGSKSTQIGGVAGRLAADAVVERATALAADYLEASAADVVLDLGTGTFHVADAPKPSLSWAELASKASADGRLGELKVAHEFQAPPTFPFGCHLAVVEVDTETGKVELTRYVAVDDAGTLINPLVADGQVHGGIAFGVGQALYEEVVYGEDGYPLTGTFVGYGFPSAAELPSYERVEMVTPTPEQRDRREGHRRVGDGRLDAGRAERRARRARAPRRAARRPPL